MKRKGRMIYVPPNLLNEADNIMNIKGYTKRINALEDLTKYARVGREAENLSKLNFKDLFKRGKK